LITIVGKVGTGKSFCSLTLALALDKTYNISRVSFSADEFLTLVRSGLDFGSFISAEEIGEWFGARNYKKSENIDMSAVLQTFRDKQLGVIFTLPEFRQADKNARTMGDIVIETVKVNRREEYVECKLKYIETNPLTSDRYEKFPVMRDEHGNRKTITRIRIDKPPEEFIPLYKEKKKAFGEYVNAKAHHTVKKANGEEEPEEEKVYNWVTCKCGHKWNYKGSAKQATCTSCGRKTPATTTKI
jgi:hypothetical protein